MAGHGGGAWKVAYADFVTAMMAFFMVMWISAQSKQVKEAIAHYFNQPTRSNGQNVILPAAGGAGNNWDDPVSKESGILPPGRSLGIPGVRMPKEGGKGAGIRKPSLYVIHNGDQRVQGTILFFTEDAAELNDRGKETLKEFMPVILGKRNKIEIRGHATRRPPPPGSPYHDAWQLSYARCQAVKAFLEKEGIQPERIRLSQAGPFEPYSINPDSDKQTQNSRVELFVLGGLADELMGHSRRTRRAFQDAVIAMDPVRISRAFLNSFCSAAAIARHFRLQEPPCRCFTWNLSLDALASPNCFPFLDTVGGLDRRRVGRIELQGKTATIEIPTAGNRVWQKPWMANSSGTVGCKLGPTARPIPVAAAKSISCASPGSWTWKAKPRPER